MKVSLRKKGWARRLTAFLSATVLLWSMLCANAMSISAAGSMTLQLTNEAITDFSVVTLTLTASGTATQENTFTPSGTAAVTVKLNTTYTYTLSRIGYNDVIGTLTRSSFTGGKLTISYDPSPLTPGTVSGFVKNSSGTPVIGASVNLTGYGLDAAGVSVTTGDDGSYSFDAAATYQGKNYTLAVTAADYDPCTAFAYTWGGMESANTITLNYKSYTVTFESNGAAQTIAPQTVNAYSVITSPTAVTRSNYVFDYWYLEGETEKFDFSTRKMPQRNITLYAKWHMDAEAYDILTGKASTAASATEWYNTDVVIKPENTGWQISGDGVSWGSTLTISSEGENNVTVHMKDADGNTSVSAAVSICIDKTQPGMSVTYSKAGSWAGIPASEEEAASYAVTGSVSDALSGVNVNAVSFSYTVDGSPYSDSVVLTQDTIDSTKYLFSVPYSSFQPGEYTVTFSAYDNAGNVLYETSIGIKKDVTDPTVAVAYSKNNIWTAQPGNITVTASDNLSGIDSVWYSLNGGSETKLTASSGQTSFTIPTDSLPDGSHSVSVYVKDIAGNCSTTRTAFVLKDTAKPTGTIVTGTNTWSSLLETITFGLFFKESQEVQITFADAASGVSSVNYYVTDTPRDDIESLPNWSWSNYTAGQKISLGSERKYIVYARIVDVAGNTLYMSSEGFVIDKTVAKVKVSYDYDNTWTCQQVDIPVEVSDVLSGIKSVQYQLGGNPPVTAYTEATGVIAENDKVSFTIPAGDIPDGSNSLAVTVIDKADNSTAKWITINKDTTAPQGTVTVGSSTWDEIVGIITFGIFHNTSVTVSLTSNDLNGEVMTSGVKSTEWFVSNSPVANITQLADWQWKPYKGAFTLNPDQKTIVYIRVTDYAGNRFWASTDGLVLDQTDTNIQLSYTGGSTWTNQDLDVGVTVTDQLAGVSKITYKVGSAEAVTAYTAASAAMTQNDTQSFTIPHDKLPDGEYLLTVEATDKAGNTVSRSISIKKDRTAPALNVSYDKDNIWINDTQSIRVTAGDALSGMDRVEYTIDGGLHSKTLSPDATASGQYSLSTTDLPDGSYTLTVTAYDCGGNAGQSSVTVKKDTKAPTAKLKVGAGFFESLLSVITFHWYYPESQSAEILANDQSDSTVQTSGVARTEYILSHTEIADISALESSAWIAYEGALTLPADNTYVLYAHIVDTVGNETYIGTDGLVLDSTKPGISLAYAKNDVWTNEQLDVGITVTDALSGLAKVSYRIGSKAEVVCYSVDSTTVMKPDDEQTFTISSADIDEGQYAIVVTATDKAGNVVTNQVTVKKDCSKPTGNLTIGANSWQSLLSTITFGVFRNVDNTVAVTAEDERADGVRTSGVKSIQVCITESPLADIADAAWTDYVESTPPILSPDRKVVVYAKVTDQAGNIAYLSSDGMVFDKTQADITMVYADAQGHSKDGIWTNQQLDVGVTVTDSLAGLAKIAYRIGSKAEVVCYTADPAAPMKPDDEQAFTISSSDIDEGQYAIVVTATDKAGNVVTDQVTVKKDCSKPTGSLTIGANSWQSLLSTITFGVFRNVDNTLAVTAKDERVDGVRTSGVKSIQVCITESPLADIADAAWTDYVESIPLVLSPDCKAVVYAKVTDQAGNISYLSSDGMVYDKTRADIAITYTDAAGNSRDGVWTHEQLDIGVEVSDVLAGIKKITYKIGEQAAVEQYSEISPLAAENDRYSFTVGHELLDEGVYYLLVQAEDKAGNISSQSVCIKKDTTKPTGVIKVGNSYTARNLLNTITFGLFFNTRQSVVIESADAGKAGVQTSGVALVQYYLSDHRLNAVSEIAAADWISYTGEFYIDPDRAVILYARVTDGAGNIEDLCSNGIIVDATVADITMTYDKDGVWTNQELDIQVGVTDALAGIKSIEYSVGSAAEGTLDTVTQYTEQMALAVFNDSYSFGIDGTSLPEGSYDVVVTVRDKAENVTSRSVRVKKDLRNPTGTVTIDGNSWDELLHTLSFGLFYQVRQPVVLASADVRNDSITTSGVQSVDYFISEQVVDDIGAIADSAWRPYDEANPPALSPDILAVAYARITDTAGNRIFLCSNGVVVDHTVAQISMTYAKDDVWTNEGLDIEVSVTDALAGIKSIDYTVGSATEETFNSVTKYTQPVTTAVPGDTQHFTIDHSELPQGSYRVMVTVRDKADNETSAFVTVKKDLESPTGSIKLDQRVWNKLMKAEDITFGIFYAEDKTAVITSEDVRADKITCSGISSVEYIVSPTPIPDITLAGDDQWQSASRLTLDTDQLAVLYARIRDYAGNCTYLSSDGLVIDKTAAQVTMSYDKDGVWTNNRLNVTIDAADAMAGIKSIQYSVGAVLQGTYSSVTEYRETTGKAAVNDTYSFTVLAENLPEGNYDVLVKVEDKSGNVSEKTVRVKKDLQAPEGSVTAGNNVWSSLLHTITFGLFYKQELPVSIDARDTRSDAITTSGISRVDYCVTSQGVDESALETLDWRAYIGSFTLHPDSYDVVYSRITDQAGNVTYISSNGLVLDQLLPAVDQASPVITISPSGQAGTIYNADVPIALTVTDPASDGTVLSGLNTIRYRVYYTNREGTSVTTQGTGPEGALYTFGIANPTQADLHNSANWSGSITVDSHLNNYNDVFIEVTAVDNAGNQTVNTARISIDITAPAIKVSYADAENDSSYDRAVYFRQPRTATIVVTERNFNPAGVKITMTNTDGVIPSVSSWAENAAGGSGDGTTHTATIRYEADGDYTFDITCTDSAGNGNTAVDYGDSLAPRQFTVDTTRPVISVGYDNTSEFIDSYYQAARVATITIREHNFDRSRVIVTGRAENDGEPVAFPALVWRSSAEDVHVATISYTQNARYHFTIRMQDMSGNASDAYAEETFTVDTIFPELSITNVENNSANSGEVRPVITYSDTNLNADLITLVGANQGNVSDFSYQTQAAGNQRILTFRNIEKDDIYTLTARVTDKAGNTTTKQLAFSVNRGGSVYAVESKTKAMQNSYISAAQLSDLVIRETNVNTLQKSKITMYKSNRAIELIEGTDYYVAVDGDAARWKTYTYTLKKELFKDDAVYSVVLFSQDEAGNYSDNTMDEKSGADTTKTLLTFTVDNTMPYCVPVNIRKNGVYTGESMYNARFRLFDNNAVSDAEVFINGEPVQVQDQGDGTYSFVIPEKAGYSTVRVAYHDPAGNQGETVLTNILVVTSSWMVFFYNKPLFYGSIGGAVALIAAVYLLIALGMKRKKRHAAEN